MSANDKQQISLGDLFSHPAFKAIMGLLQIVFLGLLSWTLKTVSDMNVRIHEHELRITQIEASRFTSEDAMNLLSTQGVRPEVNLSIQHLNEEVAEIKQDVKEIRALVSR